MISESTRSRNPAGHPGLLENLLALASALTEFFETRVALVAQESKAALVQLIVLAGCLILALILFAFGYGFLVASAIGGLAHVARLSFAPMRKKKIYIDAKSGRETKRKLFEAGFALGALKIAAGLVRPVIVEFAKKRLIGFAGQSRPSRRP